MTDSEVLRDKHPVTSHSPVNAFHSSECEIFLHALNNRSFTLSKTSPVQLQRLLVGLLVSLIGTNPLPVPSPYFLIVLRPVWDFAPRVAVLAVVYSFVVSPNHCFPTPCFFHYSSADFSGLSAISISEI